MLFFERVMMVLGGDGEGKVGGTNLDGEMIVVGEKEEVRSMKGIDGFCELPDSVEETGSQSAGDEERVYKEAAMTSYTSGWCIVISIGTWSERENVEGNQV